MGEVGVRVGSEVGGFDEGLRGLRVNGVAITPQASHSGGSPMSQRERLGFNWPPFGIAAEEPVSSAPETVNRAGSSILASLQSFLRPKPAELPRSPPPSAALGVAQPASFACSFSGRELCVRKFSASGAPLWSLASGLAHDDRQATAAKSGP